MLKVKAANEIKALKADVNNVELVSDIQQSDSVIHIHVSVAAMKLKTYAL